MRKARQMAAVAAFLAMVSRFSSGAEAEAPKISGQEPSSEVTAEGFDVERPWSCISEVTRRAIVKEIPRAAVSDYADLQNQVDTVITEINAYKWSESSLKDWEEFLVQRISAIRDVRLMPGLDSRIKLYDRSQRAKELDQAIISKASLVLSEPVWCFNDDFQTAKKLARAGQYSESAKAFQACIAKGSGGPDAWEQLNPATRKKLVDWGVYAIEMPPQFKFELNRVKGKVRPLGCRMAIAMYEAKYYGMFFQETKRGQWVAVYAMFMGKNENECIGWLSDAKVSVFFSTKDDVSDLPGNTKVYIVGRYQGMRDYGAGTLVGRGPVLEDCLIYRPFE